MTAKRVGSGMSLRPAQTVCTYETYKHRLGRRNCSAAVRAGSSYSDVVSRMTLMTKVQALFRRKPLTDDELKKRETAERAKADLNDLKGAARPGTQGYAQLERLRDNDTYPPS
jgi:hypothetical protein